MCLPSTVVLWSAVGPLLIDNKEVFWIEEPLRNVGVICAGGFLCYLKSNRSFFVVEGRGVQTILVSAPFYFFLLALSLTLLYV